MRGGRDEWQMGERNRLSFCSNEVAIVWRYQTHLAGDRVASQDCSQQQPAGTAEAALRRRISSRHDGQNKYVAVRDVRNPYRLVT